MLEKLAVTVLEQSVTQGRRHVFESGEYILPAKRAEIFLYPHFLASGGATGNFKMRKQYPETF